MSDKWVVIDQDGIVINVIVSDAEYAKKIGASPYVEGTEIGVKYPSEPTDHDILMALLGVTE